MKLRNIIPILGLLYTFSLFAASPGDLDPTFNGTGYRITDFDSRNDVARAVDQQSNGKIVTAGYAKVDGDYRFAIARYNNNGVLDLTYGGSSTGTNTTAITCECKAYDAVLDGDGKLVVVGYAEVGVRDQFAVARYTTSGVLDTTFGGGAGYVTTDISVSANDQAYGVAIQSDGKIVVVGKGNNRFTVIRYGTTGAVDVTFNGGTGIYQQAFGASDYAWDVKIQSDDKILVVGQGDYNFVVLRLNSNGTVDTTFGELDGGGPARTGSRLVDMSPGSGRSYAHAVAIYNESVVANRKIVTVGVSVVSGKYVFALLQLDTNGDFDSTFGSAGKAYTKIGSGSKSTLAAMDVSVDEADNRIIVVGEGNGEKIAVARYNFAGVLDTSFGGGVGYVTTNVGNDEVAYSVVLQSCGKIITAGMVDSGGSGRDNFIVLRYLNIGGGSARGYVFKDLNGNGIQDSTESGIASVDVKIKTTSGTLLETVQTDSNGLYVSSELSAGAYVVEVDTSSAALSGYTPTTNISQVINVSFGCYAFAHFGFQQETTISGIVFVDTDGDGVKDPAEVGLDGVTITLSGDKADTTITADGTGVLPLGNYQFDVSDVGAGTYTVTVTVPAGYVATTLTAHVLTIPVGGAGTANFGVQGQGTVSGFVFDDLNGNGVKDMNEDGIPSVTVTLYNSGGVQVDQAATGSTGSYSFAGVTAGSYTVTVTIPSGYVSTGATSKPISVVANGTANASFGLQQQGFVSGITFNDLNGDGIQQPSEQGLGGVVIALKQNGTTVQTIASSPPNGIYQFTSVDPGTYTVESTIPTGFAATTPNSVSVTIGSGGSASANFGFQGQGTVSGSVFDDINGDGIQQGAEPGLAGVTITLTNLNTSATETSVSVGDGSYLFTSVAAGSYTVAATTPSGFNPTTSTSKAVVVTAGSSASANFGFQEQSTVTGVIFNDHNGNGAQDPAESGITGITITLVKSGGGTSTTTSLGNGTYSFSGLSAGTYTVSSATPTGFTPTTTTSQIIVLAAGDSTSVNFGFQEQGVITGAVFNDVNGDGVQDPSETGLNGVTVTLKSSGGTTITSTTTLANGSYTFGSRDAATYIIEATTPSGFTPTTVTSVAVILPAGGSANASFGFQQTGTISGTVFSDVNGDGIKQPSEPGLGTVTVTLKDSGGTVLHTAVTNSSGGYSFTDQEAGAYVVTATTPTGFIATTATSQSVSLAAGGAGVANFGFQQQGSISGNVFLDLNGDGVQDVGESGIGGVTVTLSDSSTTSTAGDGSYIFRDKTAGSYTVTATTPTGFVATTQTTKTVVLMAGASVSANFGFQQQGSISGNVFNDLNGNGVQDAAEPGLSGVTVLRKDSTGTTTLESTTTLAGGSYSFTGVDPGTYIIEVTTPTGFTPSTVTTRSVTIASGESNSANFGFQQTGSISGIVFEDLNADGIQQPSEHGIGAVGVTLTLTSSTGTVIASTTSVGNGSYIFTSVIAGTYYVNASTPTGYSPTTVTSQQVVVPGASSANFGFQPNGTIGGTVFNDLNGNGLQGSTEPGLSGITITLSGASNQTTTTASNGDYSFCCLLPGTYTVSSETPTDFVATTATSQSITIVAGGSGIANFGFQHSGYISGIVFDDENGDGVKQPIEGGIRNVTVTLKTVAGVEVANTTTDTNGFYQFDLTGLSGNYLIDCSDITNYANTTPQSVPFTVGSDKISINFGFQRISTISGTVFLDHNSDSVQRLGGGLNAYTVDLYDSTGTSLVDTTITDVNGNYSFTQTLGATAKFFIVKSRNSSVMAATTVETQPANLNPSVGVASVNYGKRQLCTCGGVVFHDRNGDGMQQSGEDGVSGVTVTLRNFAGNVVATSFSNSQGVYSFGNIPPGQYSVEVTPLEEYGTFTTGTKKTVCLKAGGVVSANFGATRKATISGSVWNDSNGDGIQQWREVGILGVIVTLKNASGVTLQTKTTNGNGHYRFFNLDSGTYTVHISNYPGYTPVDSVTSRTVIAKQSAGVFANFGLQAPDSIQGGLFFDLSGDGIEGLSEQSRQGPKVTLYKDDVQVDQTFIGSSGMYNFSNISAGTYNVVLTKPEHGAPISDLNQRVTVSTGGSGSANYGMQMQNSISGVAFYDRNKTGSYVLDYSGVGGVVITVRNLSNEATTSTITSVGDGSYLITGLSSGSYKITATTPSGYIATTPITKTVTVSSGIAGNANFGFYARTYVKSGLAAALQKRYCRTGAYSCPYAS